MKTSILSIESAEAKFCAKFICHPAHPGGEGYGIYSFPGIEEHFCVYAEEREQFFAAISSIRTEISTAMMEKQVLDALNMNLEIAANLEKLNNKDAADLLGGILVSIGEMLIEAGKSKELMMSYVHTYKAYIPLFKSATEFLKTVTVSFFSFSRIANKQGVAFENEADNAEITTRKVLASTYSRVKKNVAAMAAYIYS